MTDRPRPEPDRTREQDDRAEVSDATDDSRAASDDVAFGSGDSGRREQGDHDRGDDRRPDTEEPADWRTAVSPVGPGDSLGDATIGGDDVVPATSGSYEMSIDLDDSHVVDPFAVTEVAGVDDSDTDDGIE